MVNKWKESLDNRLPFYWQGENIDSLLSVIASEFDVIEDDINEVKISRRLNEIDEGEAISNNIHLDKLARNVGQVRDVVKFIDEKTDIDVEHENDTMLRNRTEWNIDVQQSEGISTQIKDLVARGLVMYRIRTGLGGYVYEDTIEPANFRGLVPPEFNIPESVDKTDQRYVEPNDIYVFQNRETGLGIKAPDAWHGKFGNLTNFYELQIPWKALPWSEGANSLQWKSQDSFDRPYYTTFTSDDIDSGLLNIDHNLDNNHPVVTVMDGRNKRVSPDNVTASDGNLVVDLSSYTVEGTWNVRLTGSGYSRNFFDDQVDDGVFHINHNLNQPYPSVAIYNSDGVLVSPDSIEYVDSNNLDVNLSGYTIDGTWFVTVVGGENSVSSVHKFDESNLGAREMTITHGLGADTVHTSFFNNSGVSQDVNWVEQIDDDTIKVQFPSSDTVQDTWHVNVSASRAKIPEDVDHGWNESVYTGKQEDLHIEPVNKLAELTRPAATEVGIKGYGGLVWKSQDEFDNPEEPGEDTVHGWGARWDGDLEETEWAMENLDDFWVNY